VEVQLQDGIVIYWWIISGAIIIVGVIFGIRWAYKNGQFNEDIKYQIFETMDDDMYIDDEKERQRRMEEKAKQREDRIRKDQEDQS